MTDEEKKPDVKLESGDLALIRAAATGEGAVLLTPERLKEMGESIRAREKEIKERFPKLVEECPYETRLAVTSWVFENVVEHARDGGSFRYLIYTRLGFESDAYTPLYLAGGMEISNEFDLSEDDKGRRLADALREIVHYVCGCGDHLPKDWVDKVEGLLEF